MSHRYFFDHNLSYRIADALRALGVDAHGLSQEMPAETPDEKWLELVGGRVVVTCDLNIRKKDVFRRMMHVKARTVIFLGKSWARASIQEIAWRVVRYWWAVDKEVATGQAYELHFGGKIERLSL